MDYLPLFADIRHQPCLVVGGGSVARRKVELLLRADALVTVNAPEIDSELAALAECSKLTWVAETFNHNLLNQQLLVIAATNDAQLNGEIAALCKQQHTLCNVVDDREASGFIMPAIVDRSPIQIAISSGGTSPVLATRIRQQLEVGLPKNLGKLAEWSDNWRTTVRQHFNNSNAVRHFWRDLFAGPTAEKVLNNDTAAANNDMTQLLASTDNPVDQGEAYIVGAGCGDPDLLTLRGAQLLQQADVVLYDRLVAPAILDIARRDAEKISVGKEAGATHSSQDKINQLLVKKVSAGLRVCRLKGGDPFIFGRGSEEIEALAAAGLSWQVVPGITSASGASAYAGIPLTHRGLARSVVFVTARDRDDQPPPNWGALAAEKQTVVLYMGVAKTQEIQDGLMNAGKAGNTPVAVIQNGTTRVQKCVRGRLDKLDELVQKQGIKAPAVIIVGEVTQLADKLHWFEPAAATTSGEDNWLKASFVNTREPSETS
ncbi:MAG: siroheme synthase CysG [Gammaproteobacteria bacterium]|nr:siroheme synthase CysG [Gammaproteobacteria bacterium]